VVNVRFVIAVIRVRKRTLTCQMKRDAGLATRYRRYRRISGLIRHSKGKSNDGVMRVVTVQAVVVISLGVVLAVITLDAACRVGIKCWVAGPCNPTLFLDDARTSALCEGPSSDAYIFVPLRTGFDRRLQAKYAVAAIAGFRSLFFVFAYPRRRENRLA
jgi:hypothetical protein